MSSLLERYAAQIVGVLSCFDRVIIQGTLAGIGYPKGMSRYLAAKNIRIFDFPRFAVSFRELIRENAERIAQKHGVEIEFIRRLKAFRKEDRVAEILKRRGQQPGLVHIFSAMETCTTFEPWHDKKTHTTCLRSRSGKCLHYYFYFIDPLFGLCYLRVPTWAPFRLQFYFNGHSWLASQLAKRKIGFELVENAFVDISDFVAAQQVADRLDVQPLHKALDHYVRLYCPVDAPFETDYHWSLMQVELATDILFKDKQALAHLYDAIVRTAIHAVKAEDIAKFLGKKLTGLFRGELGTDFKTRLGMTRIKHYLGPASIKMYDKFGRILRIETTANDVSFFKHHRKVEQKDGQIRFKVAPLKKTIYSLNPDLRGLLLAANQRYLAFVSALEDPTEGAKALAKIAEPIRYQARPYRGFNLFAGPDQRLFEVITRGEFNISGFRNRDLRRHLPASNTGRICRSLKRLRLHGLIKRIGGSFKYYLTDLGRRVVIAALHLKQTILLPKLAQPIAS